MTFPQYNSLKITVCFRDELPLFKGTCSVFEIPVCHIPHTKYSVTLETEFHTHGKLLIDQLPEKSKHCIQLFNITMHSALALFYLTQCFLNLPLDATTKMIF